MITHSIKLTTLELAHLIWLLYDRISYLIICIYYFLISNIEQANKTSNGQINSINTNLTGVKNLRIPRHIALSFTNESKQLDLEAIARLICWCKQLNVNLITLYDDLGRLKDRQKELIKLMQFGMQSTGSEEPNDYTDGLSIISRSDGRQKFVEEIKDLIINLKPENINIEQVHNKVGWPSDPELLITFGSPVCLYDFPPWQLRLTEILSIQTHRNLPQKIFIDCLKRYSRTSQREGV